MGFRRILLIDDDPVDCDILRCRLNEDWGDSFGYRAVGSGREGLEALRDWNPDCVLLDLNLPDMKGLDLLRALVQAAHGCPIVVITAYGSEEIAAEAMRIGAADYLIKATLNGSALSHSIDRVLEREALRREVERQRQAIEQRNRDLEAGIAREMSARAAAEENEKRYRTLAEAIPQMVWTARHPGGEVDYVNERWEPATGTPDSGALGHGWLKLLHPEDCDRVAVKWAACRLEAAEFECECRLRSADGAYRWNLLRAVPVRRESEVLTWLGTFTDIEEQRRAQQALAQQQRLESIGLLAGGLAHDFNNLLVGIIGSASYAMDLLNRDHEIRPMLDNVLKSGDRAAHLIRQMLAYAGKSQFLNEQLDLTDIVRRTWDLIRPSIPSAVTVQFLTRQDLPSFMADASQVEQIVMNLLINALEAIPSGRQGRILVRTDLERVTHRMPGLAGDLEPGDYLLLEVRDDGCGMDEATRARIFDPFFTTKFTGRGLGLAAVQGILRSVAGGIVVESAPERGTRFKIFLPPSGKPAHLPKVVDIDDARATSTAKVLVVDDEEVVRKVAKAAMEGAGHEVNIAVSGDDAIDMIRRQGPFSLIVLDLGMPGKNGVETLADIRLLGNQIPVLLSSGYSEPEMRRQSEGLDVAGFVQKPYTAQALRDKVAECLRQQARMARTRSAG